MKLRTKHSPLLFLLLPSLANALLSPTARAAAAAVPASIDDKTEALPQAAQGADSNSNSVGSGGRRDIPTKDAPVDGKDGKPHLGPFVGSEGATTDGERERQGLPPLKGRPSDPTMVDGKKIPESNDGIMFDKNRERPQEGTTGTEGGVSEKDKARKAHESKTGEKPLTQPESPKEQPPLPHSEQEKMDKVVKSQNPNKQVVTDNTDSSDKAEKVEKSDKGDKSTDTSYTGLDKPDDLPDRSYDESTKEKPAQQQPPSSKDHFKINKPDTTHHDTTTTPEGEDEGIIQPFHSFVLSLTMILFSEIGDKTFLVAALMAMKHDRMVVFSAAFGALLVMTVLSAVLGHAVPSLLPKKFTSFAAACLFFVFGAKMLREGMQMDPNEGVSAEMYEVEQELAEKEKELGRDRRGSVSEHTLEMGLDGRGSRSKGRFAPPRSPSQSPSRSPSRGSDGIKSAVQGVSNLCSLLLSPAWVQTFVMTFLGEWGDRSQIATIAMAAGPDYWWVTLGASVGHAVCTGVAVIGGRAIAGRVSLKVVTVGGACAFLLFGFIYFIEAFYA